MTEKFLHVSCIIQAGRLYDLLTSIEQHKVGNLEVRAVAPTVFAGPPEKENKRKTAKRVEPGEVLGKVRAAMKLKEKKRVPELATELGVKKQSAYSAIVALREEGVVKKVGVGLFMRTKPDKPAITNGSAE